MCDEILVNPRAGGGKRPRVEVGPLHLPQHRKRDRELCGVETFEEPTALPGLLACFFLYGFHFGFAEGAEKALIADLAPPSRRGAAFGWYTAVQGVGALAASLLFGFLWTTFGATTAFATGATLALIATILLFVVIPSKPQSSI